MDKEDMMKLRMKKGLDTYIAKNKDYGDSFAKSVDKYGYVAPMFRIEDKFNRIDRWINNPNQEVKSESIIDTLEDLSNYCLMLANEIDIREGFNSLANVETEEYKEGDKLNI